MPQIGNLVLADGQSTPANKTFEPFQPQTGDKPAEWWEKSSDTITGFRRITASLNRNDNNAVKVKITISDPVLSVTAPSSGTGIQPKPTVSYRTFCAMEFTLPTACTLQNRKDILAYAKNLLANAVTSGMVVDLQPVF